MKRVFKVESLANVHTHLREGRPAPFLVERAIEGGADVLGPMPNTIAGLKTAEQVRDYIKNLYRLSPDGVHFLPIVMITEDTTVEDIDDCIMAGIVNAKVYPRYRTTNSGNGVVRYGRLFPLIHHCGKGGMKVHFHPEHPSLLYSNRDAELMFLPIVQMYLEETDAIIVWEHGTDARCIPHWKKMAETGRFFVTLTAHHLATNEDRTFGDVGATCKPPIKTELDRNGLVQLVLENHSWVMAGGDDAFHPIESKHVEEGRCACGAYTAPFLLPLYAHALKVLFIMENSEIFVNFTSRNARRLHKLPPGREISLVMDAWKIPTSYTVGTQKALPFWAGQHIDFKIQQ